MKRSPLLREQVAYLTQKLYGKSSEQTPLSGQIKRLDYVQHAYKCKHCSLSNESDKIVKAPVPKAPLAHSYGSASIIAHTLYQKYELKVPAYRQENDWQKMGLPVTRQDIINWPTKSTEYYLSRLGK